MTKREKRPCWFKMFQHHCPMFQAAPDDVAGRAIKAAMAYFDTGEVTDLPPMEEMLFASMKLHIDESFQDYEATSEMNRQKVLKRWRGTADTGGIPQYTGVYRSIPKYTEDTEVEEEVEAEEEKEKEGEGEVVVEVETEGPTTTTFSIPSLEQVTQFCRENGYRIDPERFLDYYTVNGWMSGNHPVQDWQAMVRMWNRRERAYGEQNESYTVGTVL